MSPQQPLIDHRYELRAQLGRGAMGSVHRAYDRLSGQTVALKQVLVAPGQLAFSSLTEGSGQSEAHRLALAREFRLLASLRHPHIISVLDYGFDRQQPYFTMSLLEGARDLYGAARGRPVAGQFRYLAQMLLALAYLHRRGIVHRDLKPGNVLVDAADQVRVLDFGLALEQEQARGMVGTLAYMAPEVMQEQGATPASDLYAVGVMAYELFAGSHPFAPPGEPANVAALIMQTLHGEADLAPLPEALRPVAGRLLAKDPAARYPSALAALAALAAALGQPRPPETRAVRESFLQAATFVGREAEMARLQQALADTLAGAGSGWLVGGESGVGKTRLLEELRTRALVAGALTLRGQAVPEGAALYQLWREILRHLCLRTALSPLEAGVIRPLVPDVERLLGRPVPPAPELDPEATQRRLFRTVAAILHRQPQPLVLILEDLQWADAGLDLLRYLSRRLAGQPVLLVGSYRDDERPELPQQLPALSPLRLERFERETVAALSTSMLGPEAGRRAPVLDLLVRETEGNVFFLVEVIRALAEEAGRLDRVGEMTLPTQVFAEGIVAIVRRRLAQVPPPARPLLQVAAVRGRRLDLPLLQAVAPAVDLEDWLAVCNDAAVLEVRAENWQFAHDKLREELLRALGEGERRALHRQVAEGLSAVYGDEREHAQALAFHWGQAGDRRRQLHYQGLAGEVALAGGAHQQAVEMLNEALTLSRDLARPAGERAALSRLLGEAYLGLGDLPLARATLLRAARGLGVPFPAGKGGLGWGFLWRLARQLRHRVWAPRPAATARARHYHTEVMHSYRRLGEIFFLTNEAAPTVYATLRALNAAEHLPPGPEQAVLYANMVVVAGLIPWHRLARTYRRRAQETLAGLARPDSWAAGNVYLALAIYETMLGQWPRSDTYTRQVMAEAEAIGDQHLLGGGLNVLGTSLHNQGAYAESLDCFRRLYDLGRENGNRMHEEWGLVNQAACLLRRGEADEALLASIRHSLSIQAEIRDRVAELNSHATLALAHLRRDEPEAALAAATAALPLVAVSATSLGSYEGFHDVPTVFLALWEGGRVEAEAGARAACKHLAGYARLFRFARPAHHLCQGRLHRLDGRPGRAADAFARALAAARLCRMPYEEALAHAHRARMLPAGSADRAAEAEAARALFARLGAVPPSWLPSAPR